MQFDWAISLRDVLTVAGFFGTAFLSVMTLRTDLKVLAQRFTSGEASTGARLAAVELGLERTAKVLVEIARQEERLSAQDRRMNDLANRVLAAEAVVRGVQTVARHAG